MFLCTTNTTMKGEAWTLKSFFHAINNMNMEEGKMLFARKKNSRSEVLRRTYENNLSLCVYRSSETEQKNKTFIYPKQYLSYIPTQRGRT